MVYASSKDALRRSLDGIATEIQGTDFSEVAYQESTIKFLPFLSTECTDSVFLPQFSTRSPAEVHRRFGFELQCRPCSPILFSPFEIILFCSPCHNAQGGECDRVAVKR